jgi:anti-sigma factor RsiW
MKCDQVQTLHGPYLDSELDARTSLEIQQHLATCPACAHLFAEQEKLEARITAGLNRGPRTVALWEQIEREVVVASSAPRLRSRAHDSDPVGCQGVLEILSARLRSGWQASRWAWGGLAAVWMVILALNFAGRESDTTLVTRREVPSASEMRLALKQRQLLMADLALASEPVPATHPRSIPPSPRSERRDETLNA